MELFENDGYFSVQMVLLSEWHVLGPHLEFILAIYIDQMAIFKLV